MRMLFCTGGAGATNRVETPPDISLGSLLSPFNKHTTWNWLVGFNEKGWRRMVTFMNNQRMSGHCKYRNMHPVLAFIVLAVHSICKHWLQSLQPFGRYIPVHIGPEIGSKALTQKWLLANLRTGTLGTSLSDVDDESVSLALKKSDFRKPLIAWNLLKCGLHDASCPCPPVSPPNTL